VSGQEGAEPAGERQVPFYCPYCGDEDLRPAGAAAGSWRCGGCARAFELRFAGVSPSGQDRVPVAGDAPGLGAQSP
jgi:ribosomal protein L37AE/L43A